jgi:tetratricopeptide (TPR) repeat protein
MTIPAQAWQAPRAIRVFVSSTFRDMQAEREELVKRVFPRLRNLCESRAVTWGEVDLRWGVTDEQKADGLVLPICLAEIRRCRPFFIGLLGERYGWVPDRIPPELMASERWLALHEGRSVTELEILHGVLNDPAMADHAFFYFRDPAYVDSRPANERSAFVEGPTAEETAELGEEEARRHASGRERALAVLKDRIRASGVPVRERVPDPIALGELVLRDLTAVIDRLFPEGSEPSSLERERARHEMFARTRSDVYIGRGEDLDRLDRYALGSGPPVVVAGESGIGKSALLANWAARFRVAHPECAIITHFIGASSSSTDWMSTVVRILGEIASRCGVRVGAAETPDALRAAFVAALRDAGRRGRVVLVIDGLDQLEDQGGALDLVWLPVEMPPGVQLILSTLPGRPCDELNRRSCPVLRLASLDGASRVRLVEQYLAQYSKSLDRARTDRVCAAPQTGNPLFLRALLEELRVHGDHLTLDRQIGAYLSAPTIDELYQRILERYERDYERERPGLVRDSMSYIWASRRGLSEAELLDLLGSGGHPLPRAYWSPLFLAAEPGLVSRGGLLSFFHGYLRRAVERRYLAMDTVIRERHLALADYFARRPRGIRQVEEWPWQLQQGSAWGRLADLLGDQDFLAALDRAEDYAATAYWAKIELESPNKALHTYREVLKNPRANALSTWQVITILKRLGYSHEALVAAEATTDMFREEGKTDLVTAALLDQAGMRRAGGQPAEALALTDRALEIFRQRSDRRGIMIALEERISLLDILGRRREMLSCLDELARAARETGDDRATAECAYRRASLLAEDGRYAEALPLLESAERVARERGNPAMLLSCLDVRARMARGRGSSAEALTLYAEMERLSRESGDRLYLAATLMAEADLLRISSGTRAAALAKCREAQTIYASTGREPDRVKAKAFEAGIKAGLSWTGRLRPAGQRMLSALVSLLVIAAGGALGMWNPWLWLLGVPLIFVGAGNLLTSLFPRLLTRSAQLTERLSGENREDEVRRGGR